MIKKTAKKLLKICLYVLLTSLICIMLFIAWIYISPRSLPFLTTYIEEKITELLPQTANLDITDTIIGFDNNSNITIKLQRLKLEDTQRGSIELNEVKLRLDFLSFLPQSNRNFINIQISYPKINFKQSNIASASNQLLFEKINGYIQEHKNQIKSFSISLENTSFSFIGFKEKNVDIIINTLSLKPVIYSNNLVFIIYGDFNISGKNNILDLTLDTTSNQYLSIKGYINNISVPTLQTLGIDLTELKNATIEANLSFTALLKSTRSIDYIEFELSNFKGMLKKNNFFASDIKPDKATIKGYCHNNCSEIEVENVKLSTEQLNFDGQFNIRAVDGHPTLAGKFAIKDLPVNKIPNYWPTPITPRTRDWIFDHISNGTMKTAYGTLKLNLDNIKQKKRLSKDDINISLKLEKTSLLYMDKTPKIYDADAELIITGEDITFTIQKAKILESIISNATGYIPNLGTSKSRVDVICSIDGSVQDLIDLSFAHAEINNTEFTNLHGTAHTDIKVSIPLIEEDITLDHLDLLVTSSITNFNAHKVYRNFNISKGTLKAHYENKMAKISGSAYLNDKIPVEIQAAQNFSIYDRSIKIKANMDWNDLALIGINKPSYFNNFLNAEVEIKENKNYEKKTINLDITPSTLWVNYLALGKKIGEPGTIKLELIDDKKQAITANYAIKIGNFESVGNGQLASDFSEIKNITSSSTRFNRSNLAFTYKKAKDGAILNINGEALDLSNLSLKTLYSKEQTNNQEKLSTKDGFNIYTKMKKIYLKNGITLTNPNLEIDCNSQRCEKIKLKGSIDNTNEIKLDYNYPVFSLTSNNAGITTQALDITSKIQGGKLNLYGKFNNDTLKGELLIETYYVKKAPILAKILSLASLTVASFEGAASLLGDQGVKFDKLSCPFTYKNGVINIEECKTVGKALAITGAGTLNFNQNKINVSGTVIPENIINKAINNIPIIGSLFSSDNAFIGVNYNIDGSIDEPKVNTNPLSMLTPGFLRRIFNIAN